MKVLKIEPNREKKIFLENFVSQRLFEVFTTFVPKVLSTCILYYIIQMCNNSQ